MAKRLARKVGRLRKYAMQFRYTSTLEYIDVTCNGNWRPELLRVIWLRSHRRVQSVNVQWVPKDDQGPNGAEGRAVFDPPLAISLIVTLYKQQTHFESKDYKYLIENDSSGGKKIIASFVANLAEYVGGTTSRHALEMNLEPLTKKIRRAILGVTIESEFLKQGSPDDDDMQSTFSAVSIGGGSLQFDEDDEYETDEAAPMNTSATKGDSPAHESSPQKEKPLLNKAAKRASLNPFDEPSTNPFGEQTPPPTRKEHSQTPVVHTPNTPALTQSKGQQHHRTPKANGTVESHSSSSKLGIFQQNREAELLQRMKEKDQIIASLKEENEALQETIRALKLKLESQEEHHRKQAKQWQLKEHELKGWLYKTGVKGLTASVWRRRYFRLDLGEQMHYYKSDTDSTSKGFINLRKVLDVREVSETQQDKNNATFHVQCQGRTYRLQAINSQEMKRWIKAINYLREFYASPRTS